MRIRKPLNFSGILVLTRSIPRLGVFTRTNTIHGWHSVEPSYTITSETRNWWSLFFTFAGFVTPGPSNAALSCLNARQLCSEDPVCSQILEILPKVCGLELGNKNEAFRNITRLWFVLFLSVSCSTVTVTKCQAALRTLQGFPYFSPTCLCQEPHRDPECNQIREFIFDHPCGIVNNKGKPSFFFISNR